jgi:dTDP-4-amino-4,6-dideoxygalactose transaminase
VNDLFAIGLHLQTRYIPVHLQPYYRDFGFSEGDYPNAERYHSQTISLPLHYDLSDDDVRYIVEEFLETLNNTI